MTQQEKTDDVSKGHVDPLLAMQAKAFAVLAFRNGPIEDIHASGRISEEEMKEISKNAVNQLYKLLYLRRKDVKEYRRHIDYGLGFATNWDDPEEVKP